MTVTCSLFFTPLQPNYAEIAHYCNLWRNYNDITVCETFLPTSILVHCLCLIPRPCIHINMWPGNEGSCLCVLTDLIMQSQLHQAKCVLQFNYVKLEALCALVNRRP